MNSKKVLIVGGGIAGISMAAFLQDSDYEITLTERAPGWRTIGFAVGIWANGLKLLRKIIPAQSFWSNTTLVGKGAIVDPTGEIIFELSASLLGVPEIARTVERDFLHKAITATFSKKVRVHFNTDFTEISQQEDKAFVRFLDGSTESFDLVVAADGMRSRIRETIFGDFMRPYGWTVHLYWAKERNTLYDDYCLATSYRKILLSMPCGDSCIIGFGYANDESRRETRKNPEALLREYAALSPQMKEVVDSIDRTKGMFVDELNYVSMRDWYKGNIVLIGDAKHGMSPMSGFGTTLALSDAYTLSQILKENLSVADSLKRFASQRDADLRDIQYFARGMEGLMAKTRITRWALRVIPSGYPARLLKKALSAS